MPGSADDIWLHYGGLATTNSCFRPNAGERVMVAEEKRHKSVQCKKCSQGSQSFVPQAEDGHSWLARKEGPASETWNSQNQISTKRPVVWGHTAMGNVDSAPADIFRPFLGNPLYRADCRLSGKITETWEGLQSFLLGKCFKICNLSFFGGNCYYKEIKSSQIPVLQFSRIQSVQ